MSVGSAKFRKRLEQTSKAGWKLLLATNAFEDSITKLRELCPHLLISWCELGGQHHRVCEHCGITETHWPEDFTTLTAPGARWYQTENDKSFVRRKGAQPVVTPRSVTECYSYRQRPHVDVTEI